VYVLDTNVISELRQGKPQPSKAVCAWAASVPTSQMFLSSLSVLELELGILLLERKTPAQGSKLRTWLDGVRQAFSGRVLAFGEAEAVRCAKLHVPNRRPDRDAMIAATAMAHGHVVVTRNVRDFVGLGVKLINPWD
jgi:toxin FitB